MSKILVAVILIAALKSTSAQVPMPVADLTLKIGSRGEETLYYGFAKDDRIIFEMEEIEGKDVREVEVEEYPGNIRFTDYKTNSIGQKIISVGEQGVYKFRFYNSALFGSRVCRIKISRVPVSEETADFQTGIRWVEKFDTTYNINTEKVITGYRTVNKSKSRKVLASVDTNLVTVLDKVERVYSMTKIGGSNTSVIKIELPQNTYSPHRLYPYKSTEVVSWAYTIAVGDNGKVWYQDANKKAAAKNTTNLMVSTGLLASGYGAIGLLAIEGISLFSNPPTGENIIYELYGSQNGQVFSLDNGNSVVANKKITDYTQGTFALRLENDNFKDGINVDIKVVAVVVTKTWKDEHYTVQESVPIKEKKTRKVPKVSVKKVPVLAKD